MATKQADSSAYRELKRALKENTLGKLYILHGEETYLREHYLGQMKKALIPEGMESFNYHVMQAKGFDVRSLGELVDALPMMSERTMLVVYDIDLFKLAEDARKLLVALFADLPDYCCLVFVYDLIAYKSDARMKALSAAIKEHGSVVQFQRQSQNDLTDWISRRFRALGRQIDSRDAQYLVFLCGDLMQGLIPEIEKIAAFSKNSRVTREDIDAVAIPQLDARVFQMTDALLKRDFDKAFSVLDQLLRMEEAPIMLLSVIGKQMRQLLTARLAKDAGKKADYLVALWGLRSSFPAQKLMEARYSLNWCRLAVRRCAEVDLAMKYQTGADPKRLLLDLLLELSAGEGAYAAR